MTWEIAVECLSCTGQYAESIEGSNGFCDFCSHCWQCGKPADRHSMPTNGGFCSSECDAMFYEAQRIAAFPKSRRQLTADHRKRLFDRDGWVCHICQEPISKAAHWPDSQSAVLDHVIPWSKFGSDDDDNLRAAHSVCNIRKRDKDLGAYLASL